MLEFRSSPSVLLPCFTRNLNNSERVVLTCGLSFDGSRDHIQACMPNTKLALLDDSGISAAAKEATSFAFMGLECLLGRPMIVPCVEHSQEETVNGKLTPGRNFQELLRRVVEFWNAKEGKEGIDCMADGVNGLHNGVNGVNGVSHKEKKMAGARAREWLPPVTDLRVMGNRTREKEIHDPVLDSPAV